MNNKAFIITITGPSQSGKSTVLKRLTRVGSILRNKSLEFYPTLVPKKVTRDLRVAEIVAKESGAIIDVEHVDKIPNDCDLVYQSYGIRYGLNTSKLEEMLNEGLSPFAVVNDIRAVEELKKRFPNRVLSLFLFRKIPDIGDFIKEAAIRGNVTESEARDRYEKAVSIYRMYIENIALFDRIILNAIEYSVEELNSCTKNNIIDKQLINVVEGVYFGQIQLRQNSASLHSNLPKTFIIAGNSASGKDQLVRAIQSLGKLEADIIPKYTVRLQEPDDESEMICRLVPKRQIIENLQREFELDRKNVTLDLECIPHRTQSRFRKEWEEMKSKILRSIEDGTSRFWAEVNKRKANNEGIGDFFEPNPQYLNLNLLLDEGKILAQDKDGSILLEYYGKEYIIYHTDSKGEKLYGFEVKPTKEGGKFQVLVASNYGVFNLIKQRLGNENVVVLFAHSQISLDEYLNNTHDLTREDKVTEFNKKLHNYVDNIAYFDHVVIYAQSQLLNDKSIEEEELIDQMFRLFRVY